MRVLWVLLLPLMARAQICPTPPGPVVDHGPIFVVLVGQPRGTNLPTLKQTGADVIGTWLLFRMVGPEEVRIHLPDTPDFDWINHHLAEQGIERGAPTLGALKRSIRSIAERIGRRPGAQVYFYFSGHGRMQARADRGWSELFLEDEAGEKTVPFTPDQLDAAVLAPLAGHATVHLIIDACESGYLTMTKQGTPENAPDVHAWAHQRHVARYPAVGLLSAGAHSTYETSYGGTFTTALRSAIIAHGDYYGHDGIITYAELAATTDVILRKLPRSTRPIVIPPGDRPDAPFLDLRGRSQVAHICLEPGLGRLELRYEDAFPIGFAHPDRDQAMELYLPRDLNLVAILGGGLGIPEMPRRVEHFRARDGELFAQAEAGTAAEIKGELDLLNAPLRMQGEPQIPPLVDFNWQPPPWWSVGFLATGSALPGEGAEGDLGLPIGVALSIGRHTGAWSLVGSVGWEQWEGGDEDFRYRAQVITADALVSLLEFGGGRPLRLGLGPGLTGSYLHQTNLRTDDTYNTWKAGVLAGFFGRWSIGDTGLGLRLDARAGLEYLPTRSGGPDFEQGGDWLVPLVLRTGVDAAF